MRPIAYDQVYHLSLEYIKCGFSFHFMYCDYNKLRVAAIGRDIIVHGCIGQVGVRQNSL